MGLRTHRHDTEGKQTAREQCTGKGSYWEKLNRLGEAQRKDQRQRQAAQLKDLAPIVADYKWRLRELKHRAKERPGQPRDAGRR